MMMRFRSGLLAMLMLVVCAAVAAAQSGGTITGRLMDAETQTGISAATVQVVTAGNRSVGSAVTDADGQFRIGNIPAGTYSLLFSRIGYEDKRIENVRVVAGESTIAGATLQTTAVALTGMIVTASRKPEKALEAPASVSVVREREIAERPTTNPVEHLRSTPGVDIIQTGVQSTNVVARGFNNIFSGALHTLTDYRAANVPSLRVNFLQFLPQNNDDYSRIEVVLGPGSALYGPNTANGVLHFLTKSPLDDPGTTVSIAGGRLGGVAPSSTVPPTLTPGLVDTETGGLFHGTFRTAHKLSETFGVKVSGQYFTAPEFFYRDLGEDSTAIRIAPILNDTAALRATRLFPPTASDIGARAARVANRDYDIKRWAGDARADFRPTENLDAVLSAGITNDNSIELTGIGAGQAVDWKYSYVQGRTRYKDWFAQAYVNMSDAGDTYLLRNGAPITDQSKLWAVQLQHSANLGERQSFTYGGDYISTHPETNGTINGTREDIDEYNEFGAYLQSETKLGTLLDVVLAGRYDKHSELDDAVFSPRAAVVFHPNENHNFRVTYNRAFSTPTSLNLFLDIDAGPLGALGAFGFRAHAQAPGRAGIGLHDANGNIQIRTPFSSGVAVTPGPGGSNYFTNPTALNDVSLQSIYQRQVSALGLANATVGGNAQLMGALRSLVGQPDFATVNSLVLTDPLTRKIVPFTTGVADVGGIEESTTQTFEVGYKGLLSEKVMVAVDLWHAKHKNFTSPLIAATPLVQLNPLAVGPYVATRLIALGIPAATAQAVAAGLAQLPGGVVSSAETTTSNPNLILTYINFGDLDLSGIDVSLIAQLSSKFHASVTGSLVSDDYFKLPLGNNANDSTVVALNAPKHKAAAALGYRDVTSGLNAEVRVRYQGEFPANSAGYVGLSCVDSAAAGECVKSYTLLDLTAGYRLPISGASLQLMITNLFDEDYQSFIGTPEIRRMAILRLRYDL